MTTPPRTPTTAAGRALLESEMFDRLILSLGQNAAVGEDEFADAILAIEAEARAPLDVDRSKACPLDLDCYRFQGHPGEHMYAKEPLP
jgi:hypothetical protein